MRTFLLITIVCAALFSCRLQEKRSPAQASIQAVSERDTTQSPNREPIPVFDSFGYRIDTLRVQDYTVQRNESFYLILDKFDFTNREIYSATSLASEVFEVEDLKPGQRYRVYRSRSGDEVRRMVWQPNTVDYVVFDWTGEGTDSLSIHASKKQVNTQLAADAARIDRSLYETMVDNRLSPLLAYKLSEIFAWQIDFFSLRPGDRFKILYEKIYVDDAIYDMGEIKAAEFVHRGETYTAIRFDGEEISGYFDTQGGSVQKALLKAPFSYSQRISSHFSHSRFHPVLKRRMPHYGVDYAAPYGTPVLSVGDGTVTEARYRGANGNIVKIRHNGSYETAYLHLKGFARGIRRGASVKQGQVIGYVGNTGRVTGTHLDYRIYHNGRPVNPITVELPSSESISEDAMDAFEEVRDEYMGRLKRLEYPPARGEESL